VSAFAKDFRYRFTTLLSYDFRDMDQYLCLELLQPNLSTQETGTDLEVGEDPFLITKAELQGNFSLHDLQRLDQYCKNMADFYLILDLLPYVCRLFFLGRTGKAVRMSKSQAAILVAMGLQRLSVEDTSTHLAIDVN
jgi:N-acetyltransferase 10